MYKLFLVCLLLTSKVCLSQPTAAPRPVNFTNFFCIQPNTSISIEIYYEFRSLSSPGTIQAEQKKIDYLCNIDNHGFITLPPFFESIQPAGNPYGHDLKIQILDSNYSCGPDHCVTYDSLEVKLTDYFQKNIGSNPNLMQIQVKVSPNNLEFLNLVTVYFKKKRYSLPYAEKQINEYFSEDLIRKQVGLKCRRSKFEVFSLCSKIASAGRSAQGKFKNGVSYKPPKYKIMPGDIIFLK